VDESLSCQVSLRSDRKAGDSTASSRRRRRGGGGGGEEAAAAAGLEDAVRHALSFDRLGGLLAGRIADNLSCSLSGLLARRYVATIDSDRYDRDREGRTVR